MKGQDFFANRPNLHLAMRELSGLAGSAAFWTGFACVQVVLAVSAPFDSGQEFTAAQRVIYWLGVIIATFFPAFVVMRWVRHALVAGGHAAARAAFAGGIVAGVPVGLTVFAINSYIAGNDDGEFKDVIRLIGMCTPIVVAIAVMAEVLLSLRRADHPAAAGVADDPVSVLMSRVSPGARGALRTLQSQDHYLEVTTARGQDLVLMRLADAVATLDDADGMQVHRSWWVARAAVDSLERDGHRLILRLTDGREVPVGRSRIKAVQAWWAGAADSAPAG